jgi:nucleotide-binding universal stress UspA family protein
MKYEERIFRVSYLFRKILVGYDGSENSEKALEIALELSRNLGSEVTVIHACEESNCDNELEEKVKKKSSERGVTIDFKRIRVDPSKSSVASELVKEINSGAYDLVIMGVRGTSISEDTIIGSTAASVFLNTRTSYLFIR